MVGWTMPPHQDVNVPISRTCEYFALRGNSNFTDVIVKDLEMERLFWIIQVGPI